MNSFCRSGKREATREDESKLNYTSPYFLLRYLNHYTNNSI